jgi:hypothetical protein
MNKHAILAEAKRLLLAKQAELQAMTDDLNRGLAEDTKSSAGDKYETSRAMSQQELDKIAVQLNENARQLALIPQLLETPASETVRNGSLVTTDNGAFLIGLPAGQLTVDGQPVFCIGPVAPIAQKLIGMKAGETCAVNGRKYEIVEVS